MLKRISVSDQPVILRESATVFSFKLRDSAGSDGVLRLSVLFRKVSKVFNLFSCKNYCYTFLTLQLRAVSLL